MKTSCLVLFNWFSDNFTKPNSGKSHLLMSFKETTHANEDGSMNQNLKIMSILCVKKQAKNFMRLHELQYSWI